MACGRGQGGKIGFGALPGRQFAGGGFDMIAIADRG
jgi:hypothetical protein